MPEKRNPNDCGCVYGEGCGCEVADFNDAIDACTLAITGALLSVEEELKHIIEKWYDNPKLMGEENPLLVKNPLGGVWYELHDYDDLAQAIYKAQMEKLGGVR